MIIMRVLSDKNEQLYADNRVEEDILNNQQN
jgi:hypothetical protein